MRWIVLCLLPMQLHAESLVANRTIAAGHVIQAADLTRVEAAIPGAITDPEDAIGKETRQTIFPGRPIFLASLGAPTLIARNQIVTLIYESQGLSIKTEGRALSSGGTGDVIRVINLASRNTVVGRIQPDGTVLTSSLEG